MRRAGPRASLAAALGAAIAAAGGCTRTLDDVVSDYEKASGLAFEDCGAASVDCLEASDGMPAPLSCLASGYGACKPVKARTTQTTVEGDPIRSVYLVVPDGGECRVVHFLDTTEDGFGPQRITRYECGELKEQAQCPWVYSDSCDAGTVEEED